MRPWLSAWCPSVAEIRFEDSSVSLTGSAPLASTLASCVAVVNVKLPLISEPLAEGMPVGYWLPSIWGTVTTCWSSVTAKCCQFVVEEPATVLLRPRVASVFVTFWKMFAPLPLKPKLTTTPFWGSVVAWGFEMSEPVR